MKHHFIILFLLCSLTVSAQTVTVIRPQSQQQTTSAKASGTSSTTQKVISVRNAEEFINAIGSNRTIRVMEGFNITPTLKALVSKGNIKRTAYDKRSYSNAGIYIQDTYVDELELVMYNIHNLTVEGIDMATSLIQTEHYGAFVLVLESCSGIKLKNLTLGHVPEGGCMGGVVEMNYCRNCTIENCDLYGCGTVGISAKGSDQCKFNNSTIRDCSSGIMELNNCSDFHFSNSKFIRNREYDLLEIWNCTNVDFTNCTIAENKVYVSSWSNYGLYKFNCNVVFKNCRIDHDSKTMGTTNYAIMR